MFAGIQIAHWVNSEGLELMSSRTSFDITIAHRCGKLYAFPAKEDGKITKLTEDVIVVTYNNGKTDTCKLGKQFGNSTGKTMLHHVICDLKPNAKFNKGDILAFNKLFFKRDWFNPTQVGLMLGVSTRVALRETLDTYEDGCGISSNLSKRLATTTAKTKDILANFNNDIADLVKVGDIVKYNTPLCVIKESFGGMGETTGVNLEGLQQLGDGVPLAKMEGVVESIEVLYCGDVALATDSVSKIIKVDNRRRKALNEDDPSVSATGEILEPTFIANNYVGKENILIRIRLTHKDDMVTGDKLVFDGPLKSVPGAIYTTPITTVRGYPIDGIYSYAGVLNRIVLSPVYTGILNLIMYQIGLNAIAVANGGVPAEPITESY